MLKAKPKNDSGAETPDIFEEPRDATGHISLPLPKDSLELTDYVNRQTEIYIKYRAQKPTSFSSKNRQTKPINPNVAIPEPSAPKEEVPTVTSKLPFCCFRCC